MASVEYDFSDLRAVYVNCTLKRSPDLSHTAGLMAVSTAIMRAHGVEVDEIRAVDHEIAPGVYPDMTNPPVGTPATRDDWPVLWPRIEAANMLVVGTPIWLGERSTQRNATFMTWNLMHLAALLARGDGIPAWGNVRTAWDSGERFDHPNPEYR